MQSKRIRESRLLSNKVAISAIILLVVIALLLNLFITSGSIAQQCQHKIGSATYLCFENAAEYNSNASYCLYIKNSSYFYNCIYGAASNIDSCYHLNGSLRDICIYDNFNQSYNVSDCSLLGNNSAGCYYRYMLLSGDTSYCKYIENSNYSYLCNSITYYKDAILYRNSSYCSLINNSAVIRYLILRQGYGSYLSPYLIYNISNRDACLISIGYTYHNSSYCSYISNQYAALYCKDYLNSSIQNLSLSNLSREISQCQSSLSSYGISDTTLYCSYPIYTDYAIKEKNITACNDISNATLVDLCVYFYSYYYKNTSYCSLIKNSSLYSNCTNI
ncbi:MAG: hypothetical protein ARM1_0129 [Candidatus Micrarchaeota archaeon]|nr:MAG: hypothetical protein ARM1_0129 [Candidatus Micrarchaeota archaeon]